MGLIALEGMRFYAYHGFYEEEQVTGNDYIVDIYITTNFSKASAEDDLYSTVNYETVYFICKNEMNKPKKLLETLGANILLRLKYQFPNLQAVKLRIRKSNPPLGGRVAAAYIEIEDSFVSKCGRCGKRMVCYNDETCWCQDVKVHPNTQDALLNQFNGCLCRNCLSFYSDKN